MTRTRPGWPACASGTTCWPTPDGSASTGRSSTAAGAWAWPTRWCWPRSSTGPARPPRSTPSGWPTSPRRSWPSAPTSRRPASCDPCCAATRSGARASASPTPAATWRHSPPERCATATTGSITGQKVWNTYGQLADWCELLVRTDPRSRPHQGISCLIVDMSLPGIEVRPLRTATGDADFCELFFDDVRVPRSALLGPEGEGWTVAMATLTFERSGVANLHIPTRRRIARAHRRGPRRRAHRRPDRAPGAGPAVDRRPRSSGCCRTGPPAGPSRGCPPGPRAA